MSQLSEFIRSYYEDRKTSTLWQGEVIAKLEALKEQRLEDKFAQAQRCNSHGLRLAAVEKKQIEWDGKTKATVFLVGLATSVFGVAAGTALENWLRRGH
jgi:hypothetical protein